MEKVSLEIFANFEVSVLNFKGANLTISHDQGRRIPEGYDFPMNLLLTQSGVTTSNKSVGDMTTDWLVKKLASWTPLGVLGKLPVNDVKANPKGLLYNILSHMNPSGMIQKVDPWVISPSLLTRPIVVELFHFGKPLTDNQRSSCFVKRAVRALLQSRLQPPCVFRSAGNDQSLHF